MLETELRLREVAGRMMHTHCSALFSGRLDESGRLGTVQDVQDD
jgi:hypothetical protein